MRTPLHSRPKNQDRITPFYDEWLEELRRRLEPHGSKVEMARFISARAGKNAASLTMKISSILSKRMIAGGEFVCGANAWMRTARRAE